MISLMASAAEDDAKTQDLNFVIKALGEQGKTFQRLKEKHMSVIQLRIQSLLCGFGVTTQLYGSAAENLQCLEVDNFGDVDAMVFPNSDNLMVNDGMIEYLPEHPMHVRIKGANHPVLQSCLAEDTEYVATSAVKNFHHAIYGFFGIVYSLALSPNVFSSFLPFPVAFKNNKTGPAVTYNLFPQPFGSEHMEDLKDSRNVETTEKEIENSPQCEGGIRAEGEIGPEHLDDSNEEVKSSEEMGEGAKRLDTKTIKRAKGPLLRTANKANEYFSTEAKSVKDNEEAELSGQFFGVDYVPALRSLVWPRVAWEWIKRERKWPSPDIVDNVIHEGFHLVVKPPKNGGNPDCDFRISFSHAEHLLSQEMNDIQRECYRCLKKYHRVYLSTEPKVLLTYHLKNILLQTIEETGADMWCENNRAECMMKLLGNLLEALRKRHLPHYFVRSYNLFCTDYIESPEILKLLVQKVEQIITDPVQFARPLMPYQISEIAARQITEECLPDGNIILSIKPTTGQGCEEIKRMLPIRSEEEQKTIPFMTARQGVCGHHDIKDIYLAVTKELTEVALNDPDCSLEGLNPLEMSLVEDIRGIGRQVDFDFEMMFPLLWKVAYFKMLFSTESDTRSRVLDGIQFVVEAFKYMLMQEIEPGDELSVVEKMFDPFNDESLMWRLLPAKFSSLIPFLRAQLPRPAQPQEVDLDDIPLD